MDKRNWPHAFLIVHDRLLLCAFDVLHPEKFNVDCEMNAEALYCGRNANTWSQIVEAFHDLDFTLAVHCPLAGRSAFEYTK